MRSIRAGLAGVAALVLSPLATGFGGEDIAFGKPWHHEHITLVALTGDPKWDPDNVYEPQITFPAGAESIAWHADNIDSYLYNPVFWARGAAEWAGDNTDSDPFQRTKASLVGFEDLAKLHFDDTFTNAGLRANWERYAMGTLIGLVWASDLPREDGIAAGHHLLGISFHAVQDFYSHSSWVSQTDRRCHTYFELPKESRDGMPLFAGAYESPVSGAPAHHGAYSLSCTALRGETADPALGTLCGGYSPLQNTSICQSFRNCSNAGTVDARIITSGGMLIRTNPPGIALDNTALSRAQAQNRALIGSDGTFLPFRDGIHFPADRCKSIIRSEGGNVCEVDADQIFAGTKDLAIRATMEWAQYLEKAMYALGKGDYWESLKTNASPDRDRFAQFETFSKLPYHFLAAGDYPVSNPTRNPSDPGASARGWFLRLRIKTADEFGAGTNADIVARVRTENSTRDVLLDYLPTDDKTGRTNNRLLVYDDFERGDDDAYTIGPFAERPISVTLVNKSAGFTDVLEALANDFVATVDGILETADDFVTGLAGGFPDFVGSQVINYTKADLLQRLDGGQSFTGKLSINGGSEGHHEIVYTVTHKPSSLTPEQREDGWIGIEIALEKLRTIKESTVDRFSTADEPFVIFHIAPLNNLKEPGFTYMSPPFEDMDDDEEAPFRQNATTRKLVKIPKEGRVVVSAAVYESDDEDEAFRDSLKTQFVTGMDRETLAPTTEFTDTLGAAIAEDWIAQSLEVYAFHRSAYPLAGPVLATTAIGEIDGGEESREFVLDWNNLTDFAAAGVPPVLELESPSPDAKTVLHGTWHSDAYECAGEIPYVEVTIEQDGTSRNQVVATKTRNDGDACVDDRENGKTFRGTFENGILTGERYIVPPPRDRPIPEDPDNPLHRKPDWRDPSIDANLGLEGNWIILSQGASFPYMMATLTKGGAHGSGSYEAGDTHLRFRRDPDAPWAVNFLVSGQEGSYISGSDSVEVSGARIKVDWPYGRLGHWGGVSILAANDQAMNGQWFYQNEEDPRELGPEIWVKTAPIITHVGAETAQGFKINPLWRPLTIDTEYADWVSSMRGNRDQITLNLYGRNLWGRQYIFMPTFTDIEYRSHRYICDAEGASEPVQTSDWKMCMQNGGGVVGLSVTLTIWQRAVSGNHTLYVNDQEIPFRLNVINEPLREGTWQPMKMAFNACSSLSELDRDYYDQPISLVRQDFRPKPAPGD